MGKSNGAYAAIRPRTSTGVCPTIKVSINNMSVCDILSVSHFPIPGVVEIFD